jgi:hypothetical protein
MYIIVDQNGLVLVYKFLIFVLMKKVHCPLFVNTWFKLSNSKITKDQFYMCIAMLKPLSATLEGWQLWCSQCYSTMLAWTRFIKVVIVGVHASI